MTQVEAKKIIDDVCKARGLTLDDLRARNDREGKLSSARRAIAVLVWDKFGLNENHNSQVTWSWLAQYLNMSRGSLHWASRRWAELEGAQDGQQEVQARKKGFLLPESKESIHQMAKRVRKRRPRSLSKGGRGQLGYWWSKEEMSRRGVNHG
jgi:hypothetical protein